MWLLVFFFFSTFLFPERVHGCQSNVTEIYEDVKLTANVNCSLPRLRKIYGRLELSASKHNSLISLPMLEEIVGRKPALLTIRATSAELTVHLPRLAALQFVGNSSTQPLIKIEGPVVVGARLLLNLKRLSGGKMEVDGVSLAAWLSKNKPPDFSPKPLFYFLCTVSLLILIYVLLRGFHQWQVMKLDEEVKKDLTRMRGYLLERRKAKFDRFKGDKNVRRILGIVDRATPTVDKESVTMKQWLAREQNKDEEKTRRQERFSICMGNKLEEAREKTTRPQTEDILRKRRQKADGLSKAYKRAEKTSGEKRTKKK